MKLKLTEFPTFTQTLISLPLKQIKTSNNDGRRKTHLTTASLPLDRDVSVCDQQQRTDSVPGLGYAAREEDHRAGQAGLCVLSTHTCPAHGSARLSLPASRRFTHVRAPERGFVHADRCSWKVKGAHCVQEQCSSRGCTCKYTCTFTFKFRCKRAHAVACANTSPPLHRPPTSPTICTCKYTRRPSSYPQPCELRSAATCCDPPDHFFTPTRCSSVGV